MFSYRTNVSGKLFAAFLALGGVGLSAASAADYAVLHNFPGAQHDGEDPYADVQYAEGNLYGTTAKGGSSANAGTIFRIARDGSETILYAFTGKSDGNYPYGITLNRTTGEIFGVAGLGGLKSDKCTSGCGVIYKLSPTGAFSVLHSFNYSDGNIPVGRLVRDSSGSLYGTTNGGGSGSSGTIFKLAANGSFSVLHNFAGGSEGRAPNAGLQRDKVGNLYGTAFGGAHNYGVVF